VNLPKKPLDLEVIPRHPSMIKLSYSTSLSDRNAIILEELKSRSNFKRVFEGRLLSVNSTDEKNTAIFSVTPDALKLDIEYTDENDEVTTHQDIRVNVSAAMQQELADAFGCSLLTGKIADLLWDQTPIKINPQPRQITASTIAMIQHSEGVDRALVTAGVGSDLISTVGKHWILDNKILLNPGKACNYGWHFTTYPSYQGISGSPNVSLIKSPSGTYWNVIQPNACAHDPSHVDYSQICVLVSREVIVNGYPKDILDVFQDEQLCKLANHDGVLKVLRQS
jgi:hypothetical protein